MTAFFTKLFRFVISMSSKYNIDSSHDLSHSLAVLNFANKIYEKEQYIFPPLKHQEKVVYSAAVLHDMCDKKYVDPEIGKSEIENLLGSAGMLPIERRAVIDIVDTMSYSKVITSGFPYHGEYQRAYHIVREADLLAGYDFDRCMVYKMQKNGLGDLSIAFEDAENLFHERVFKHEVRKLFTTDYAQEMHPILMKDAQIRIESWRNILGRTKRLPK